MVQSTPSPGSFWSTLALFSSMSSRTTLRLTGPAPPFAFAQKDSLLTPTDGDHVHLHPATLVNPHTVREVFFRWWSQASCKSEVSADSASTTQGNSSGITTYRQSATSRATCSKASDQ
jgi:hypothetical protein